MFLLKKVCIFVQKVYMEYKNYTYEELLTKRDTLISKRDELMDQCAREGLSFDAYIEKASGITEDIYYISREMRLKQSPTMEYGKTWKGDTYPLDKFIQMCKSGNLIDDDGIGYYATENAKSDICIIPSDCVDNEYRTDFTHIIWFNK